MPNLDLTLLSSHTGYYKYEVGKNLTCYFRCSQILNLIRAYLSFKKF